MNKEKKEEEDISPELDRLLGGITYNLQRFLYSTSTKGWSPVTGLVLDFTPQKLISLLFLLFVLHAGLHLRSSFLEKAQNTLSCICNAPANSLVVPM